MRDGASDEKQRSQNDPEAGIFRGRRVARVYASPGGHTVLVGRNAHDNDLLTLRLAGPKDFFFHVAGQPGSHVVVLNPEKRPKLDRETARFAASLAAAWSSASKGGNVGVHQAVCADVSKPRGLEPGEVRLRRHSTLTVRPSLQEEWRADG